MAQANTQAAPANARASRRPRDGRASAPEEKKEFDERIVHIDRVARVVKGGRRFRFRALVVAGNHKGKIGIGIAKGADVTTAVTKATEVAKKHMTDIAISHHTIRWSNLFSATTS